MQRFVILHHQKNTAEESHWDIMLETDNVLRTWALVPPQTIESFSVVAGRLPDHRLAYLDYEGEISDERGTVKRIDAGTYSVLDTDTFHIEGKIFRGTLTFSRYSDPMDAGVPAKWLCCFTSLADGV